MVYTTLDEAVKKIVEEIVCERKTEIKLQVVQNVMSRGSVLKSIYEADPRLILCTKQIRTEFENLGLFVNVHIYVEYSDIMPLSVTRLFAADELTETVLQATQMHQRNVFLVYDARLSGDITVRVNALLDSYKVLNCYVKGIHSEVKRLPELEFAALIITFSYSCTYREWLRRQQSMQREIDKISKLAKSKGKEDWKKAQTVIGYCVNHWSYGKCGMQGLEYTAYGALVEKKAVCMGISLAICQVFKELGIPCRYIRGIRNGEGHAWNMVYIRQGWFYIDVTDAICRKDPLYHWGMVDLDDRTVSSKISENLVCNCSAAFIRQMGMKHNA